MTKEGKKYIDKLENRKKNQASLASFPLCFSRQIKSSLMRFEKLIKLQAYVRPTYF